MTIKQHKSLDKKIWLDDENLRDDVHDMLMLIVWDFIDYVRNKHCTDIRNADVIDVILFGSETNYFYTKKSDIDVCVVIDISGLKKQYPNMDIMHNLKLYYYDWKMLHDASIRGRKIDLNFESGDNAPFCGRFRTGANYSVLNREWIFKPVMISGSQLRQIKTGAKKIYKQIMRDFKIIKHNGFNIDDMNNFYHNIAILKRAVYTDNCNQIITPLYVALRKLKEQKIFDILRKKSVRIETKKFVLK